MSMNAFDMAMQTGVPRAPRLGSTQYDTDHHQIAGCRAGCHCHHSKRASRHQSAIRTRLEIRGPVRPYFLAIDNGHFKAAGLEVEISPGKGSLDAIPKVATGAFPVGFADINSLIKLDQNPGAPVTAVMMVYDKPPFAVVGRKSQGISGPGDLEGSVLGTAAGWCLGPVPILAKANNIDVGKIRSSLSASRPASRCWPRAR